MPKMIQIRNVPDRVHRELTARAAREGMTLSDFLKRELELITQTKSLEEIWATVDQAPSADITMEEIVELIREDRESH